MVARPMRRAAALACCLASLAARPALAGTTQCWVDHGVVVAPAAFGDIAGDFIFDLSSPRSVLHLDVAELNDVEGDSARRVLRLAGERIPATVAIAPIDDRAYGLPSTISGLIGADVLAGYVVDIEFAPCRISLWRRRAPKFRATAVLPVQMVAGAPAIAAAVADGRTVLSGLFAIDTGSLGVRLAATDARLSRTPQGLDAGSRQHPPARLGALSLADDLYEATPAAVASDIAPGLLGGVGTEVLSHYRLRLDVRRRELLLAPATRQWATLRQMVR
ncbi:MAG TPA: hypothetical protein VHW60_06135 [Caulobacteraceae bacterium]|jgi:hypothetical protein|nr:hypothetical protein [Caulobacteraceae bacterium]